MKKKPAKPAHGGKREGAGRKTDFGRKRGLSLSLTPDVLAFLESIPKTAGSRSEVVDACIRSNDAFKIWMNPTK